MGFESAIFICELIFLIGWSFGYFFQCFELFEKKHGNGYSLNFQWVNTFGHVFFLTYSISDMFINKVFIESSMDFIYSLVTGIMTVVLLSQTYYYPHPENFTSLATVLHILIVCICRCIFYAINK